MHGISVKLRIDRGKTDPDANRLCLKKIPDGHPRFGGGTPIKDYCRKRTVVLSHLEGHIVAVAKGKEANALGTERKVYDIIYTHNGGSIYDSVVVRYLLDIIAKLAKQVRVVSKSGDRNDPLCSPLPGTVGELRSALCTYNTDLRIEREMLVGNDRKTNAMPHITVDEFLSILKEFEDAMPVRMLGKNGRKCGHPRLFVVKKGDNPYHIEIR